MGAAPYEVRVRGRLGAGVIETFADFDATLEEKDTVLSGHAASPAALHALLEQIEAFGLELIELRRLDLAPPA